MAIEITTNISAHVEGGPSIARSLRLEVDAYDLIDVEIADGATDEEVEVQPGAAGQVLFLLVIADSYDPALSYKVNVGGNPSHDLDREVLLVGGGALGLLDDTPNSLLFTNAAGQTISVQILVGRNV